MTADPGAAAGPGVDPALPPMPPRYPGHMNTTMADIEPGVFATRIWDLLLVHGPLPYGPQMRENLPAVSSMSASWHDYQRYHHEWYGKDGNSVLWEEAYVEYIHRALEHGVRRGWLAVDGAGVYSAVLSDDLPDPSGWAPLPDQQLPPEQATLTYEYPMLALQRKLTPYTFGRGIPDPAMIKALTIRAKPDPKMKAALKRSLREVGQLYPIIRWRRSADYDWQVIDGVTREELLLKICEETGGDGCEPIKYLDLPEWVPLSQVLGYKIAAELTGSTKTEESRGAYVLELNNRGIKTKEVGEAVGLSRSRTTKILNAQGIYRKGKIDAHKDEILAMRAAGWVQRDIAAEVGFSRVTIQKALDRWDAAAAEFGSNVPAGNIVSKNDLGPAAATGVRPPRGKGLALLRALSRLGTGTDLEIYQEAALSRSGNLMGNLAKQGWIEQVSGAKGSKTNPAVHALTEQARALGPLLSAAAAQTSTPSTVDIDDTVEFRARLADLGWTLSKEEFLSVVPIFARYLGSGANVKTPSRS